MNLERFIQLTTQYQLLTAGYGRDLTKIVQKYLDEGWGLYGPPNSVVEESWSHFKKQGEHIVFSQAVVKKQTIDEPSS